MRTPTSLRGALVSAVLLCATLVTVPAGAQADDEARPADDQITRLYRAAFGRNADAGGFEFWTNEYRREGSLRSIAEQFALSPEFVDRYGADPSNAVLVDAMYANVLERAGDGDGVRFWQEQLASGATDQIGMLLFFTDSPENIERTGTSTPVQPRDAQLLRLYRAAFGRSPDAGGFAFWMDQFTEATSLRTIALRFSQSPEFEEIYGVSPQPTELVDRLYLNVLDREGDTEGTDFWVDRYQDGQSIPELLVAFADSGENLDRTGTAANPDATPPLPASVTRTTVDNMRLPDGTCGLTNDTGRQLSDGKTAVGTFGEEITVVPSGLGLTDFDGDGATDAVIELSCFGGGNAVWSDAIVWLAGSSPFALAFNDYASIDLRGIAVVSTSRNDLTIAPGVVQIEWRGSSAIDPSCCPSTNITTEVTAPNRQVEINDTVVNGPELNVIAVINAAATGGPLPDDLPVTAEVWEGLSSWLNGTSAIIDPSPCFRDGDEDITCLFATPDSPNGISVFVYMRQADLDATWVAIDWEGIIHAT